MKLYEITNEMLQIIEAINSLNLPEEGNTLRISELEKLNEFDDWSQSFKEKAIAISSYIKNKEAELTAVKDAMDKMNKRKKRLEREIEYFESYLKEHMEKIGLNEIKDSPYFVIKIKQNPHSVTIINEESIPNEYKKERIDISIDKKKLLEDLKMGLIIEGAELSQKTRIEIK